MSGRRRRERRPLSANLIGTPLVSIVGAFMGDDYRDADRLPATGPCIVVANHLTKIDPLLMVRFVWRQSRMPRFLAKRELFELPVVGPALTWLEQIPVDRGGHGVKSMAVAEQWLRKGSCVVIYPEGTLTRDPELWPMRGQSGAVRLCLDTDAPIIPVAHWGAQEVLPRYSSRLHLFPRRKFHVQVGEPLLPARVRQWTQEAGMRGATDRLMLEITRLQEGLRGERKSESELWHGAARSVEGGSEMHS